MYRNFYIAVYLAPGSQLGSSLSVTSNLDDLRRSVDDSVSVGWQYLINNLGPDVDRDNPTMRAALIVGGLVADQPFIAGAIDRPDGREPAITRTDRFNFYMLGGEEQNAQAFFHAKATEAVQRFQQNPGTGIVNNLVKAFIVGAEQTIRFVETHNSDIGGVIHYVVIRKTFPYTAGQL